VAALKTVFDPEIPADIYELGLIYKVDIKDDRTVDVVMTLTTPNCPAAGELPTMVENAVASVPGVGIVNVNLVWEPGVDAGQDDRRGAPRPQYVVKRCVGMLSGLARWFGLTSPIGRGRIVLTIRARGYGLSIGRSPHPNTFPMGVGARFRAATSSATCNKQH